MKLRDEMVRDVTSYLREHFPDAKIGSREDALTRNEVFTVLDAGTARHVEVTERWFDQDDDVMLLPNAIKVWGLAEEIRKLPPSGILRVTTTGIETVP